MTLPTASTISATSAGGSARGRAGASWRLPRVDLAAARRIARRVVFGVLVLATIAAATLRVTYVLRVNEFTFGERVMLLLFVVLMLPVAMSFWLAAFGFVSRLRGRDALSPVNGLEAADLPADVRSAIVVPVHNEDPVRVSAGIKATYDSLARTGQLDRFDVFILSDTTDPDVWVDEEIAYATLRAGLSEPERLHYRKRRSNTEAKAGNIADFCAAHGDRYRYMIVLDADSVMTGKCIVNLVRLMEKHPNAGIIQAPPVPVNRQTLFGRLQQFAARAYGPLFQAGLSAVQGGEGNYYGHNAILRIAPFREHCRLPKLPGDGPLSGHVMSHDFIEAAFMRRAGFRVFLAHELTGSYEEPPPTLIDYAARDRRWCQGNLQHSRLLFTPGFNPVSRIHLFMGIMAYVSAPLWLVLLMLSTIEAIRDSLQTHTYFAPGGSLFPIWRIDTGFATAMLFASVMSLLFAPKLMALIATLARPKERERFGGALLLTSSVVVESLFSVLIAPVLAFLQSRFVMLTLLGRKVVWGAQERNDVGTPFRVAVKRHLGLTLIGVAWGLAAWRFVPDLFWWLSPVIAGLVLSIPLSALSSRASLGRRFHAIGLLRTPEEVHPPHVLRRLGDALATSRAADRSVSQPRDGLERVLCDPETRRVHLEMLPCEDGTAESPLAEHARRGLELKYRVEGAKALTAREKHELLLSRRSIESLAGEVATSCADTRRS